MSPTSKDAPKSRGIPATQNDAAVKEAFSKQIDADNHGPFTGIAARTAAENLKRAKAIMRQVKHK